MRLAIAVGLASVALACSDDSASDGSSATAGSAGSAQGNTAGSAGAADPDHAEMTFFVTSRGHENGGNFGGLAGADAFCQELAMAAGAGDHTWHAYLSTDGEGGEDARDRIGTGPWFNHDGDQIADSVEQLHTDGVSNGPTEADPNRVQHILDESGEPVPPGGGGNGLHDIVTGTQADGTAQVGQTCNNWTGTEGVSAQVGHSDVANEARPSWNSEHASASCIPRATDVDNRSESIGSGGGDGRIYCFAID